jgi:hypothetical protein
VRVAAAYVIVQIVGGVVGAWTAHLMFAEPVFQLSQSCARGRPRLSRRGSRPLA